jgi:hypothetical protein
MAGGREGETRSPAGAGRRSSAKRKREEVMGRVGDEERKIRVGRPATGDRQPVAELRNQKIPSLESLSRKAGGGGGFLKDRAILFLL